MKNLAGVLGLLSLGLVVASPAIAQRNFYCTENIRAGDILRAETGSIPGFIYGQTQGSTVNVRTSPGPDSAVVATVRVGSRVSLISKTYQVAWSEDLGTSCELWYRIDRGWIYGEFVRLADFVLE